MILKNISDQMGCGVSQCSHQTMEVPGPHFTRQLTSKQLIHINETILVKLSTCHYRLLSSNTLKRSRSWTQYEHTIGHIAPNNRTVL